MTKIAFVGLGSMGLPMAKNLVAGGFEVRGFDLDRRAPEALAAAGGKAAGSLSEAFGEADVAVLMVVDAAQATRVLLDEGGLAALPPKAVVILVSTCSPASVEALATRTRDSGRRFVDAPVSGGTAGATAATLTIMVAAPRETYEEVRLVLAALGDKVFYVGERRGQGAMVKTVNQLLCGVHLAVAAEALSLAAKVGLDLELMLQVLGGSSASSWMLKDRGPRMLERELGVGSAVDIFVKDLGLVMEASTSS